MRSDKIKLHTYYELKIQTVLTIEKKPEKFAD
jgi:hypothetical protein